MNNYQQLSIILLGLFLWGFMPILSAQSKLEKQLHAFDTTIAQEKIYLQTDRTFYKQGETIWFAAHVLNQYLAASKETKYLNVELIQPSGNVCQSMVLEYDKSGLIKGDVTIGENEKGGLYKLRISSDWMQRIGNTDFVEKELNIQKLVYSNLLMTLDFEQESYGAGDIAQARLNIKDLDYNHLPNTAFNYTIALAGKSWMKSSATTDENGDALIQFKLPRFLKSADGLLTVSLKHEEVVESISRSIPLLTKQVQLQFLPEGGTLVEGEQQRIAFIASDEFGEPAAVTGLILLGKDTITTFKTYHQGMGHFDIAPQDLKKSYTVVVTEPKAAAQRYPLVLEDYQSTMAMRLASETPQVPKLELTLYSSKKQEAWVTVQMQGKLHYNEKINLRKGTNTCTLPIETLPIGVAQITVFKTNLEPVAERLVFVNKHKQLSVSVNGLKEQYLPLEKVELEIEVKDQDSLPVQGNFALAVVDEKNLTLADDKQANILAQMLLNSDLKGKLIEPNFYFDETEIKADTALDYVMMTHGWRRFEWKEVVEKSAKDWQQEVKLLDDHFVLKGVAFVNGIPLSNQQILVNKKGYNYALNDKNRAQTWDRTNAKGEFILEKEKMDFPCFLSTNYRGVKTGALVREPAVGNYEGEAIGSELRDPYNTIYLPSRRAEEPYYSGSRSYGGSRRGRGNYGESRVYLEEGEGRLNLPTSSHEQQATLNQGVVRGKIVDEGSDEPLIGAHVVLTKEGDTYSMHGASSDLDGNYHINDLQAGRYTLAVSYMGYQTYEQEIVLRMGEGAVINIRLSETRSLFADVAKSGRGTITVQASSFPMYEAGSAVMSADRIGAGISRSSAARTLTRKQRRKNRLDLKVSAADISRRKLQHVPKRMVPLRQPKSKNNRYNFVTETTTWTAEAQISFNIQKVKALNFYKTRTFYSPFAGGRASYKRQYEETIYWNPKVTTNAKGKATVRFFNSNNTTSYRLTLEGAGKQQVGRVVKHYATQTALELKTKIPNLVCWNDTVKIPVILKNNSKDSISGQLTVRTGGWQVIYKSSDAITLAPATSVTEYIKVVFPPTVDNDVILSFNFQTDNRKLQANYQSEPILLVKNRYPARRTMSSMETEKSMTFTVNESIKGTLNATFSSNPNPLKDLEQSVKGLLREPSGCFEQVSATNYPNILALKFMKATGKINVAYQEDALRMLKNGYDKLVAYETKEGGFEWYGRTPPHLGLTAHGLLQFHELKAVFNGVDETMVERVQRWILNTKDGKGGFKQVGGRYSFSNKNPQVTNAYVLYALSEVGETDVQKELDVATNEALESKDMYRLGLLAMTHWNYKNRGMAKTLWQAFEAQLDVKQLEKVHAETSITNSRGKALAIEVLAMGALTLLEMKQYKNPFLKELIHFLATKNNRGRFGNTQSTIWALKALIAYEQQRPKQLREGKFAVHINGEMVRSYQYDSEGNHHIDASDLARYLRVGENTVKIVCTPKKGTVPLSNFDVNWYQITPEDTLPSLIEVQTILAKSKVKMGETVRLTTTLTNTTDEAQASTVAVVGIPAGLSLQAWQLKELQEKEKVDFIELMDEHIVFHYSDMEPNEVHTIDLDLKTEFIGTYQAPASAAYLYYYDEIKDWIAGNVIEIAP